MIEVAATLRHLHTHANAYTCKDSATSCGCVHVFTSCSIALFTSQSSCHGSSPFSFSVSPPLPPPSTFLPSTFLPSTPCNLTLSTLVSCLFANTDCSRLGLDFPVLTSSLLYLSEYLNTHSPFTHSLALMCFSSPIPSLHLFDF